MAAKAKVKRAKRLSTSKKVEPTKPLTTYFKVKWTGD